MNREESSEAVCGRSSRFSVIRIVGGAVLVLAAVGVLTSLRDIRRYWRMVRM